MRRFTLAYDADCGPCTRFKHIVEFLDLGRRFDFIPLVQADQEGMLDMIPTSLRHKSFHLVLPGAFALSGTEAIPTLVGLLPGGRLVARILVSIPGGMQAIGFLYDVLSRPHDTGSCRYEPGLNPPGSGRMGRIDQATHLKIPNLTIRHCQP